MATVDSLDIKISAQANATSASLDKLVGKLNTLSTSLSRINGSGLTGLANGVNRLSTAMQSMKSVGTADFTRLAKNVEKLGNINVANLNSAASSMSHLTRAFNQLGSVSTNAQQVGVLASNLSKLGYKSISNAITNLPLLTRELNNLMTTLSHSPRVSNNVIQMTNALANLASQGGRVGTASRTLVGGLNNTSNAMNRATKSSISLASAFGKFYASWFLAIRGIKKLWSSIESSMDYVEVLNYFDAAFDQVAQKADLSNFEDLGYASAEEYAKSFSERAKVLTAQMTGFEVTDKGTLEATGMPSLGIDPSQLMRYQAMFGQMSSSMGISSENSLKLSRALTEIGADLASVKNMDFDKVWTDMASGLAGMSRTLDKYGVNIRNVNLQQKLTELGINANITALNQNDKALLRTIILLDSTRYAWGDLADTINQPANALRLTEASFKNLGRTIGGLFLPLVQTVLPYINALVIALQRLFTWIGSLLGIDLSKITKSVGDTDFSGLIDDTGDLGAGLGDAAKNAKKLKGNLQGFDKLNIINTKDDSDSGKGTGAGLKSGLLDDAFNKILSEYQKKWDEAFANMENQAQKLADGIEKIFEPIKEIIEDFAIGDFFKAGKDVSGLVASIIDFFARAIDSVDWNKIGKNIGDFLAGISWTEVIASAGNFFDKLIDAAIDLWAGAFDTAPVETAIISALALAKFTGLSNLISGKLNEAIGQSVISKSATIALMVGVAIAGFKIGNWLYDHVPTLKEWSDALGNWIFKDGEEIAVARTISVALGGLSISLGGVVLYEGIKSIITKAVAVAGAEAAISGTGIGAIILAKIGAAITTATTAISGLATSIGTAITGGLAAAGGIGGLLTGSIGAILGSGSLAAIGLTIGTAVIGGITAAIGGWNLGQWLYEVITGDEIEIGFGEQMSQIGESISDGTWKDALKLWWKDIEDGLIAFSDDVLGFFANIGKAIADFWSTYVSAPFKEFGKDVESWFNSIGEWIGGIGEGITDFWNTYFSEPFIGVCEDIEEWWNKLWGNNTKEVQNAVGNMLTELDKLKQGTEQVANAMSKALQDAKDKLGETKTTVESYNIYDYQVAPAPKTESLYGNYQVSYAGVSNYGAIPYVENAYRGDNSETNILLRELLSEVRKGQVIECSGEALGRTIRREDEIFYDTTGVGMFEHGKY